MENRSLKELYEMLKIHFVAIYPAYRGLCTTMYELWELEKINEHEYFILKDDFDNKRPTKRYGVWSWEVTDYQSRIEFLENRIKELS